MGRRDILQEHLGLKVLYVPKQGEPTIDVVAIHGKSAHPAHTWGALRAEGLNPRDDTNYVNWLDHEEMLPATLPTARVFRYGYLSEWFGENALATNATSIAESLLDELKGMRLFDSERPLIFVAHSFGGLVVLKALVLAKQEEWKWQSILDSIVGLVFLGTPFRGTHDLLHTEILHNVEMLFQGSQVMYENHRASKADNNWLRDLLDDFFRLLRQKSQMPKIACFYEEKVTDLGIFLKNQKGYVYEPGKYAVIHVDENSACLDRTSKSIERYARACDHLSMNKFTSASHPEWLTLRRVLLDMEQQETGSTSSIFPVLSLASQAPFDAQNKQDEPDCLPGTRTEVLETIREWVVDPDSPSIFWLNGSAGAGKSTIARTISRYLHGKSLLGASFFFSRDGGETLSGARLFYTTIASQLARAGPLSLRRYIHKAVQDNRDILDKNRTFQWTNLILNPLKLARNGGGKAIRAIVVDALDECNDENDIRGLLPLLARVAEATDFQIRILIVSRPDPPIRDGFANSNQAAMRALSLDEQTPDIVDSDIRLYLIDRFQKIAERQGIDNKTWPEIRSISRLVRLSAGLFIYAATACDFVQDDIDRSAEASLAWFLEEMEQTERECPQPRTEDDSDMEYTAHLDRMYTRILQNSLREAKDEKKRLRVSAYLKDLLGALVALREPLTAAALQRLRATKDEDVRWRLNRLHSVIRVPRDDEAPLRLSHIAFRDFLLDERRCTDLRFLLDPQQDHIRLFNNCMKALRPTLRCDVCDVGHPATLVRKLDIDIIYKALPRWSRYACQFWIRHAVMCKSVGVLEPSFDFLRTHLLHWLEAMSWIRRSQESTHMLVNLQKEYQGFHVGNLQEQWDFLKDAHRFALFSHSVLEVAPLQVYCSALLFAPRSSLVRTHFEDQICSWARECGNRDSQWDDCLETLSTPFETRGTAAMAFSLDLKLVASVSMDGTIQIWNSGNYDILDLVGLPGHFEDMAFSPDNKMLVASFFPGNCCLWNTTSGHSIRTAKLDRPVSALTFSRDGLTVALAVMHNAFYLEGDNWYTKKELTFVLWDVMTGESAKREEIEMQFPTGKSRIAPDLTVAAFPHHQDVTVATIPEINQKPSMRILKGHETAVGGATFSPDSKTVATACHRSIRVWDVSTGACRLVIPTGFRGSDDTPPPPPIFSTFGDLVAARFRRASLMENYIGLWDSHTGEKRKELAMKFTFSDFGGVFAPDNESLALLSDGESQHVVQRTWDARESGSRPPAKIGNKTPSTIAFSESKQLAAVSYTSGLCELWDVAASLPVARCTLSWQETSEFIPVRQIWFSDNGERLAYQRVFSTEDQDPLDNVRVRETQTGEALPPSSWSDASMAGILIGSYEDGFRRVESEHPAAALPINIPVAGSWLCINSEPVLLLPSQCRLHEDHGQTGLLAGEGDTTVLAFASGRISALRIESAELQKRLGNRSHTPYLTRKGGDSDFYWD